MAGSEKEKEKILKRYPEKILLNLPNQREISSKPVAIPTIYSTMIVRASQEDVIFESRIGLHRQNETAW